MDFRFIHLSIISSRPLFLLLSSNLLVATALGVECTIAPPADTDLLLATHTVSATVSHMGSPLQDVMVDFSIQSGPNIGATYQGTTDANGEAVYTYTGSGGVGTDTIQASGTYLSTPFSCTAAKTWIDPQCSVIPSNDTNPVDTSHTVTVTVTDGTNPLEGVLVDFDILSGPNAGDTYQGATDLNGIATFSYTGDGGVGTDLIWVSGTHLGGAVNCIATKTWAGPTCSVSPSTDTNPINTQHTVTVTVLDGTTPLPGVGVTFNITGGPNIGESGAGTTDVNGMARLAYTGDGGAGTDTIEVSGTYQSAAFGCTASKTWVDLQCDLVPLTETAVLSTTHAVTVTVWDGTTALQGTAVDFEVVGGPNAGATYQGTTDANGEAVYTYTGSGGVGTDTIQASGTYLSTPFSCTAAKTWIDPQCSVIPSNDTNPVDTSHTVTVTVTDGTNPLEGVLVDFDILSGPNAGDTYQGATDLNGIATFSYTGDGGVGTDLIWVSGTHLGGAVNCIATKTWAGPTCSVSPSTDTNPINTQHTVTVTVLDGTTPLPGVGVTFNITGGPNIGESGAGTTDVNGMARLAYTGDGGAGTDTIEVSGTYQSAAFGCTASKTWVDLQCDLVPLTETAVLSTTHAVTVTVWDGTTALQGTAVDFEVVGGPNAGATYQGTTDANGEAVYTYTGSGGVGTDTIQASSTYLSTPFSCTAAKTWIDPQCSVIPSNDTNPVDTSHTVTVTVTDGTSPLQGVTVDFEVLSGPNAGATSQSSTDASGVATFSYTGDGGVGADTIQASGTHEGIVFSCTATKTWVDLQCDLVPLTGADLISTTHTITATVWDGTTPLQGVVVDFEIVSGPNAGATYQGTTDENGEATYTYTGSGGVGSDTIQASGTHLSGAFNCTAVKTWIDPQCSLFPSTGTNPIHTSHTVTVTLTDGTSPLQGVTVDFEVLSGPNAGATSQSSTDASRVATFSYTGDGGVGADLIEASGTHLGVPFSCTATKTWVDLQCDLVPLTANDLISTTHTVTVTVWDGTTPLQGVAVDFDVTSGPNNGKSGSGITDANGQTTYTYTGTGGVGTDTIQASGTHLSGAFHCTSTKTWIDPQCSLVPSTGTNPIHTSHTVTVTVTDGTSPLPGVTVEVEVLTGPNAGDGGQATTDVNGEATFNYVGDGGVGADTIQASGTHEGIVFSCTATKTWVDLQCDLVPLTGADLISTTHTITATVWDGTTPLQGVVVDFEIVSGPNAGATYQGTTDENGEATYTYTGSGGVGSDTIQASGTHLSGAFNCTAVKTWIDPQCSLFPSTGTNPIHTSHTVTVTLTDRTSPLQGVTIDFEVLSGPNAGATSQSSTDASGVATFGYTGDGGVGADLIEASGTHLGVPFSCTATKTWVDLQCDLAPLTGADLISTTHTITATVWDGTTPLQGVVVDFEIVSGPNAGATYQGTTDENGEATYTYTGSGGVGSDTIQASGTHLSGAFNCTAVKTWIDPQCSLFPSTGTNPIHTSHTVTVTLTDRTSPLQGVTIDFEVLSGPNAGATSQSSTDASGVATFGYTGDGGVGADLIEASGTHLGVPFSCTATKTWVDLQCDLAPLTGADLISTTHTITATVWDGTTPLQGVVVDFEIVSGPNAGATYQGTTDENGEATYTYTGSGGVGSDTIQASGTHLSGAFNCTAVKTWIDPQCSLFPSTGTNPIHTSHTVTVTLTDRTSPLQGVTIDFEVLSGPNAGATSQSSTDASGVATFGYTGDGGVGADLIEASGTHLGVPLAVRRPRPG